MRTIWQDIQYGLRILARNPGYAAVAILTLALGIGFNSAIFSLVDAIILRPLPYPHPEQLVGLGQWRNQQGEGYIQTGVSQPNLNDIAKAGIFQQVAYYRWSPFNITEGTRPESVDGISTSSDLLTMFGVPPQLGRTFSSGEMQDGKDQVAVIGHRLWQMRFGSDPNILGRTIDLNERPYTIIGVMPATFRFTWDQQMDVFVPLVLSAEERNEVGRGTSRDLQAQARLNAGVTVSQAQIAMNALAQNLAREYPAADKGWGFKVEPLHEAYHRNMQTPLMIMLGAVLLVLLIACANVANLLLARATGRKREIAIRVAIGAPRARLMQQLLTESLLLSALGGAFGLLLAHLGDRLLTLGLASSGITFPNARVIDMDWRVFVFSIVITFATGIIFGLAPSWVATKTDMNDSLKEGGLRTTAESGRRRLRNTLVISEIALALVLLTGAGLLVRTFLGLMNVNLGIDPKNVISMGISLPDYKYKTPQQQAMFYRRLLESLAVTRGIRSAGAESGGSNVFFQPQGQPAAAPGQEPTAAYNIITPDYLRTMGTRLIAGREFSDRDSAGATPVAIISETVARRYWPHANPVGSHLNILERVYSGKSAGVAQSLEIVGVAKDIRTDDLWKPQADLYVPFQQHPASSVFLVSKTAVPPESIVPSIRAAVAAIDKEQPINRVRTLDEMIAQTYGAIRFPMTLVWTFAALALLLSAVGIFGVMSYTVSRRNQELAIRVALGANYGDVMRLILGESLSVTGAGVLIGLAAATALSRVMAGYIYGITATDPITFIAASLLLSAVALFASYIPARRATKVNPAIALRSE